MTLVTARAGGRTAGLTVTAFTSVSDEPPLVAVAIARTHRINSMLRRPGASFAVNVLAQDQEELSQRFAFETREDRFLAGDWTTAATGAPVLADALAWLDCTVAGRHPAGTHAIYLGVVEESRVPRPDARPLVYWNRGYRRL